MPMSNAQVFLEYGHIKDSQKAQKLWVLLNVYLGRRTSEAITEENIEKVYVWFRENFLEIFIERFMEMEIGIPIGNNNPSIEDYCTDTMHLHSHHSTIITDFYTKNQIFFAYKFSIFTSISSRCNYFLFPNGNMKGNRFELIEDV